MIGSAAVPGDAITGQGFHVVPEGLGKHAESVERAADAVDQARQAGEQVRLGPSAYGMLLTTVPAIIDAVQAAVIQVGYDCAFALRSAADLLRRTATGYTTTDHTHDQELLQIGQGLNR